MWRNVVEKCDFQGHYPSDLPKSTNFDKHVPHGGILI